MKSVTTNTTKHFSPLRLTYSKQQKKKRNVEKKTQFFACSPISCAHSSCDILFTSSSFLCTLCLVYMLLCVAAFFLWFIIHNMLSGPYFFLSTDFIIHNPWNILQTHSKHFRFPCILLVTLLLSVFSSCVLVPANIM